MARCVEAAYLRRIVGCADGRAVHRLIIRASTGKRGGGPWASIALRLWGWMSVEDIAIADGRAARLSVDRGAAAMFSLHEVDEKVDFLSKNSISQSERPACFSKLPGRKAAMKEGHNGDWCGDRANFPRDPRLDSRGVEHDRLHCAKGFGVPFSRPSTQVRRSAVLACCAACGFDSRFLPGCNGLRRC